MSLRRVGFPRPLLSLSGTRVEGEKLVYCVIFDESGTNIHDPMLVVAGVLVDGNTQWKPLREALDELRRKYIAPEHASHFKAFHATDMFHGSGKVFGQNIRPLEESRSALLEVIKLPSRFQLPVAFGYVPKSDTPARLKTPSQVRKSAAEHHALAALFCLLMADGYLKGRCPNDVAWALAEDNTQHKKVVNEIKAMAEKAGKGLEGFERFGDGVNFSFSWRPGDFPLSKIVSGYHYAAKRDEPLLQLADGCAFVVRRWLQGIDKDNQLFNALTLNRTCQIVGLDNPVVGNGLIAFA